MCEALETNFGLDGSWVVSRLPPIALFTIEWFAEHSHSSHFGEHPGAFHPRRFVTHVLIVATAQLRHPVIFFVFVISGNRLLHVPLYPPRIFPYANCEPFGARCD